MPQGHSETRDVDKLSWSANYRPQQPDSAPEMTERAALATPSTRNREVLITSRGRGSSAIVPR